MRKSTIDELPAKGLEVFSCNKKGSRNPRGKYIAILSAVGRWQLIFSYDELSDLAAVVSNLRRRPGPIGAGDKTHSKFFGQLEVFWCDKNGERNLKGDFIAIGARNGQHVIFTYADLADLDTAISDFRGSSGSRQERWILTGGFESNRRKH